MDALDAAVRASLAAVRASVKDVATRRCARRLTPGWRRSPTMRPTTEAPPTPRAARRGSRPDGRRRWPRRPGFVQGRRRIARASRRRRQRGSSVGIRDGDAQGAGGSMQKLSVAGTRDKRDDGARARRVQRASHRDCLEQRGGERHEPRMTERTETGLSDGDFPDSGVAESHVARRHRAERGCFCALDAADVRLIGIRINIGYRGMTRPMSTHAAVRPRGGIPPREGPLTTTQKRGEG